MSPAEAEANYYRRRKTTKELDRTGGKAIDSINGGGAAFAKFFGPPSKEVSRIITDHLKYIRLERQIRLYERTVEFMRQRGIPSPPDRCR